jgi:hypothetical protein
LSGIVGQAQFGYKGSVLLKHAIQKVLTVVSTRRVEKEIGLSKEKVGLQSEQTRSLRSQAAITLIADWDSESPPVP